MDQKIFLMPSSIGTDIFDKNLVVEIMASMPWLDRGFEVASPDEYCYRWLFRTEDAIWPVDSALSADLTYITIDSHCSRGLEVALRFRDMYNGRVFAFSEESLPDIIHLDESVQTVSQLENCLRIRS